MNFRRRMYKYCYLNVGTSAVVTCYDLNLFTNLFTFVYYQYFNILLLNGTINSSAITVGKCWTATLTVTRLLITYNSAKFSICERLSLFWNSLADENPDSLTVC